MKEIDPIISLAFSMHANKGVYALLLGSGISRSAEIPTGWEIVLDLIRKLAHVQKLDCNPDPIQWYRNEFGKEPEYTDLLEKFANTPAERANLLKKYFEPTEEEIEQGIKIPTKAHHAIARLVAEGYVKVIVTTNFDRLLEKALEGINIHPIVISTPDAIEGMAPLAHTNALVFKVNGDYLDARIKNTFTELSRYDKRIEKLLDIIFDEYGLIVCGWSGEWDTGLTKVLKRCKNRRYSSYWTCKGQPAFSFNELLHFRKGALINISGADEFFQQLKENLFALASGSTSPITRQIAVSRLKKYIAEEKHAIDLHDLVFEKTEELNSEMYVLWNRRHDGFDQSELRKRISDYVKMTDLMLGMFIHGCYWSKRQEHYSIWTRVIERLGNLPQYESGHSVWINLHRLPALLLMYAGGMAALRKKNYKCLYGLLVEPQINNTDIVKSAVYAINIRHILEENVASLLFDNSNSYTPMSDYLYVALRECVGEIIGDKNEYELHFRLFEYFIASLYGFQRIGDADEYFVAPEGRYTGAIYSERKKYIERNLVEPARQQGNDWEMLKAGFFDGDIQKFNSAIVKLNRFIIRLGRD